MEGFEYVVNPPPIPKVVFGSTLERETLPLSGRCLSSFMRAKQGDAGLSPGPAARVDERDCMQIKYASKLGSNAFASKIARIPVQMANTAVPCVGTYDVDLHKKLTPARIPFGSGGPRLLDSSKRFLTPSPSTYPYHIKLEKLKVNMAFGKQRKIIALVNAYCSPFPVLCDTCQKPPLGDYWHSNELSENMCRPCMQKITDTIRKCSTTYMERRRLQRKYQSYTPMRYCSFYHDHNGTTAAVQILPTKTLKFKINKENYLSQYIKKN